MIPHISDEEFDNALQAFESLNEKEQEELCEEAKEVLSYNIEREKFYNNTSENILAILNGIDKEFEIASRFNKYDWTVFSIAIALQCLRQYLGSNLTEKKDRVDHKQAEENVKGKTSSKVKRQEIKHRFYHPSLLEIQTKPVPFDTNYGSKDLGVGQGGDHRCYTLGHDPLFGYFFGTMNILTSTVTLSDLSSFHVKDTELNYQRLNGTQVTSIRDRWSHNADLSKIISYSKARLCDEGIDGKKAFIIALLREFTHLRSDISSKNSLPLPGISLESAGTLANELCNNEVNLVNAQAVGIQAILSIVINSLIYLIHRLIRPSSIDERAYSAKTKSILVWSNFIASESNLAYCCLTGNYKKIDLGGLIITIRRIQKDFNSIEKLRTNYRREKFQQFLNKPENSRILCYLQQYKTE